MEELGHMAGAFDEYGFAMPSEDHPSVLFLDDEESNRSHSYSPQPSESVVKAWGEVCEGWNRQTAPSPLKLRQLLRKGVPREMRGKVWTLFLNADSFKAQSSFDYKASVDKLQSRLASHDLTDQSSEQSVRHINNLIDQYSTRICEGSDAGEPSVQCEGGDGGESSAQCDGGDGGDFLTWARAIRQIMLDIIRTFPTHQLFMGATAASRSLLHVLASYSLYNPAVGYCQGMAYVTALLLMNMEEEDAFWVLASLLERPKYFMGFYDKTLSRIRTHAEVFGHLLNDRLPQLGTHLEQLGIHPLMFVVSWFMCLFTTLPCWDTVLSICDLIFLEGLGGDHLRWEFWVPLAVFVYWVLYICGVNTIFKVSLTIMEKCAPELLAMHRLEDALPFLQHLPSRLVSHKMFCRALWQTTVENWEVELFQDQVLTGMESEGKRVKRVSPGEWDGGSEDGSKEPAKKRKKVAHSGDHTLSSQTFIGKLVNAVVRPRDPTRPKLPAYMKTPIPKNVRKGVTLRMLEGEVGVGNIQHTMGKGDVELMDFSSINKGTVGRGFSMETPFHHRKSPASRVPTAEDTDNDAISNGNQDCISPAIGHLRRSVRVAKRRSGVTKEANAGLPAASILSPMSVRPLQDEIHSSRVYSEQKAFRTFATPTPRRRGRPQVPSSLEPSPSALSLLTPKVELKAVRPTGTRAAAKMDQLAKMSPLVRSPAAKPSPSRKRLREEDSGL